MSALCRNDESSAVVVATRQRHAKVTVWLPFDEKQRFRVLARNRGMSEARLALIALRSLMDDNETPASVTIPNALPASERITIRLRPGDREAIRQRASDRHMKDSSYLAALVRAHVAANPPLPAGELKELKRAIGALVATAAVLSALARELALQPFPTHDLRRDLTQTRALIRDLEGRVHAYAKAAVLAWEAPIG